jgi:hypothetical protein
MLDIKLAQNENKKIVLLKRSLGKYWPSSLQANYSKGT